jgi:hypothetical protein
MSQQISLKDAERKVFRTTYNHGLWDVFLGCFFLIFVIGPYLSSSLGDFWSSFVFLPFWGAVFLVIQLLRKLVITPRMGIVNFGSARKTKLMKFTFVMLAINIVAFILGLVAAIGFGNVRGQMYSIAIGLTLLIGFSFAAYVLDFSRLFFYGLLVGLSPLVGEWLWSHGYATHHGFPITFGISSGVMILVGVALFLRFLRDNPFPTEGISAEKA